MPRATPPGSRKTRARPRVLQTSTLSERVNGSGEEEERTEANGRCSVQGRAEPHAQMQMGLHPSGGGSAVVSSSSPIVTGVVGPRGHQSALTVPRGFFRVSCLEEGTVQTAQAQQNDIVKLYRHTTMKSIHLHTH